jgi:LCP family protein required for cell wall assembly
MADQPRGPEQTPPPQQQPSLGPPPWPVREPAPPGASGAPPSLPPSPPPPDFAHRPPPRRRRRWRWFVAAALALIVYLGLGLFTAVQPISLAGQSLTVPIPGLPPARLFGLPNEPFTVMVVGLDARPSEETGPSRTDSILLLRIDPQDERAGIVSIPRDTMMQVPTSDGGATQDRVNAALVYNWTSEDPDSGLRALELTLENNLGIEIDHHIVFDQRSAAEVIDAAGGVTIVSPSEFGQDNYSDDDVTVVPVFFPEGKQHLDGYHAVAYGRIREGASDPARASDFDRMQRQQQVARGLLEQLASPSKALRWRSVWSAYGDAVETDLTLRQSAGIFALLNRAGSDRLVTRSLGDAAVSCDWCPAALQLLRPDETARIISEAFGDANAGQVAADRLVSLGVTP